MKTYSGGCHCGKVRYEATSDLDRIIECNCSHCFKKGLLLNFIPGNQFTLLSGEDELNEYQFNKKHIQHLFCKDCGVQSFARGMNKNNEPMVSLNVRCLDNVDTSALTITPFNGKDF